MPVSYHLAAMRIEQRSDASPEQMRAEVESALAAMGVAVDRVSSTTAGVEARLCAGVELAVRCGWGSSPYQSEFFGWRGGGSEWVGTPCRTPAAAVRQAVIAVRKWAHAERRRLDAYSRGLLQQVGIKPRKTKAEETPTP